MKRRGRRPATRPPASGPRDAQGFEAMRARYIEWLGVHGRSKKTVGAFERAVERFGKWCEERGVLRPSEVTKPILERYQRWLFYYRKAESGEPLAFRTQYHYVQPLRTFFRWLVRQNLLPYNPAADLELPKIPQRLPKAVLTIEEVERVMAQPDIEEPQGVRDRAILETLYSTGMRRAELMALRVHDVDLERGTLVIRHGKGAKDRVVPIGERAAAWMRRYLLEVRPELVVEPDEGTVFLTYEGSGFSEMLTKLVGDYVKAAGLGEKRGSCHLLRHTMATHMLEGGADIRFIQQMLGHAKLETTQIYTQVAIRQLKAVHALTHPSAKLERPVAPPLKDAESRDAAVASAIAASSIGSESQ